MQSRKSVWFIIILMGLSLSIFSNVYGEDWIFYGENELGKHYYDKSRITYPFQSKTIIRVWEKTIYDENVRGAYIRDLMNRGITRSQISEKGLDKLVTMITHAELDCKEMKYGFIQSILYDKNGNTLDEHSFSPIQRNHSVGKFMVIESLFEKICNL